jgi:hypothetical protein
MRGMLAYLDAEYGGIDAYLHILGNVSDSARKVA